MKQSDPYLIARVGLSLREAFPKRDTGYVVLITSATPREGKSFVARQLTRALAQTSEGDVALVSPISADEVLGPIDPGSAANGGFAGLMANGRLSDTAFHSDGPSRVYHVPAGVTAQPDRLFHPTGVARAFLALQQRFGLCIVDGPVLAECGAMLKHADAVVLVVDSRDTAPRTVQRELARAGIEPGRLAGVVLNRTARGVPAWMGGD